MGWEMIRAGAITKRVVTELESLGVDIQAGAPTAEIAERARSAFRVRSLSDYYTAGQGKGLSFQGLKDFAVVTTSSVITQNPNPHDYYGPPRGGRCSSTRGASRTPPAPG